MENRPSVATIGFFDGVHRGHRFLIEQVCRAARERDMASAVVTFPVHPRRVLQTDYRPELLTTCPEKLALLDETDIDRCILLDFTPQLASLSARAFMEMLKRDYHIAALVIGHDHRFGHNRDEGFSDYVRYGQELGIEVLQAQAFYYAATDTEDANAVSSSSIRRFLKEGRVEDAHEGLGYEYFIKGTVINGYRVGHRLGFPTANLKPDSDDKLIPADGVYALRVSVEGDVYGGMLNIGHRPTLNNGTERSIEVHILDFNKDIYQQPMCISFVRCIRHERKFDSLTELTEQLRKDEKQVRNILSADQ